MKYKKTQQWFIDYIGEYRIEVYTDTFPLNIHVITNNKQDNFDFIFQKKGNKIAFVRCNWWIYSKLEMLFGFNTYYSSDLIESSIKYMLQFHK